MGVSGQRHAPAALTPGEIGTHCTGGWVGPRAGLDGCAKFRPPPGFDPRTVQPVASRYTDWRRNYFLSLESNIGHTIHTQSLYPLSYLDSKFHPYRLTLCNLGAKQVFTAVWRTSQTRFICKNSTSYSRSSKHEVKHIYYPKQVCLNARHSLTCDVVITVFEAVHKTKHHKVTSDSAL